MANFTLDDSRKAVVGGKSTSTGSAISIHALPVGSVNALVMALVDGSGNQITSFGGGTQYAELATTASATGTLALGRYKTTLPTLTNGQMNEPMLDVSSRLLVNAPSATGAAVPANAFFIGAQDNSGNLQGATTAYGDGQSAGGAFLAVAGLFNGSNVDRLREIANATNSTGTGIVAAGLIGQFDDVSPTTITENQFGNIRMSSNRSAYTTIRDAAGNERGANVNSSNQLSVSVDNAPVLGAGSAVIGALTANQSVNVNQIGGASISTGVGTTGTGTQRMVEANDVGRTLKSASGTVSSSGNNTLVAAGTNKLKVYAFSLTIISTTAVTCIFQSGAGGTELWRVNLQSPTSVSVGANLAVTPPASLFATASATLLNLNLSAAVTVHYSVAYFDEA